MSRPIPIDIIPSHVYLSADDQAKLFGKGTPMTIVAERSQAGQYVYEETVEVFGKLKRSLPLRVLGPNWEESFVELTPTEASFLGINAKVTKTGDLSSGAHCKLVGPEGEIELPSGVIVPRPHLLCTPEEAASAHIANGAEIDIEIAGQRPQTLEKVLVRVHPAFAWRLEIHQDEARRLWLTRSTHARLRE